MFAYEYGTIAAIVDRKEPNCRPIAARARRRVAVAESRFESSRGERDRLVVRSFAACQQDDVAALVETAARDAVFVGDGGAKGNGLARPVEGRGQVGRLLVSFSGRALALELRLRRIHVGTQPAVLLVDADDRVAAVWWLHIVSDVVQEVHGVVNPDKLAHLGPGSPLAYRPQPRDRTRSAEQQEDTKMTTAERHQTPTRAAATPASDWYVNSITLLAAAFMLVAGVWALFWPDSFAEAVRFPDHTHFLHDVGAFQIGIGVSLALAVLWRDPLAVVLTGFLVGNTIHAGNHAVDLDLGGRDSDPWLLGLLSVLVAVALVRRVRQLHYVVGRVDRSSDPRLAPFVEQKTALLTTFRRDGTPVATPLSVAVEGDHAYFRTYEKAGKSKRLRNGSHVELTPSTTRGTPTGTSVAAEARRLGGTEDRHAARLLRRKHPLLQGIVVPLGHRLGRAKTGHTVHFELTPSS